MNQINNEDNRHITNNKAQNNQESEVKGCSKKCPTCGDQCVGGAHPGGYHGCSNGHAW